MENKYSCSVIRDLLPLYCKNTTSEESNEIIASHLAECKHCQEYINSLSENLKNGDKETQRFNKIAKKIKNRKIKTIIFIILLFFISIIGTMQITGIITVTGNSMEPAISNGNKFFINKIIYKVRKPQRFDVIVYKADGGRLFIKRIVGLPGETIQIKEGKIYANGQLLENEYFKNEISDSGIAKDPVKIGSNEYFVLGDNSDNSKDSRNDPNGLVKENLIVGKVNIK